MLDETDTNAAAFDSIQDDVFSFQGEPAFHSLSQCMPNQYCFMNSGSVSADQSLSGVVRM